MHHYILAVASDRSTFEVPLDAADDDDALASATRLVTKARVPIGATVTIIREDRTTMDVSEGVAPYLDRPGF